MSFDIYLQRFTAGDAGHADPDVVMRLVEPLLRRGREGGHAEIATSDGGADVYGIGDPGAGLMVNHASGREIWDVLFELAAATGFVVMPVGCGTCITDAAQVPDLPEPITLIHSGADLLAAIRSDHDPDDTR